MTVFIEAQGRIVQVSAPGNRPDRPVPFPTRRGNVTGFSKKSRLRLLKVFARLETPKDMRTTFITLTYAGNPTPKDAKSDLKAMIQRLKRLAQGISGVWRMEFQGRGSIHFHLIMFNLPYIPQRELQAMWEQITGEHMSIVHIKLLSNMKHAARYVSKYIAKASAPHSDTSLDIQPYLPAPQSEPQSIGRVWGYIEKDLLPYAEIIAAVLPPQAYKAWVDYARWRSHNAACQWGIGGFLFHDHARLLFERLVGLKE